MTHDLFWQFGHRGMFALDPAPMPMQIEMPDRYYLIRWSSPRYVAYRVMPDSVERIGNGEIKELMDLCDAHNNKIMAAVKATATPPVQMPIWDDNNPLF